MKYKNKNYKNIEPDRILMISKYDGVCHKCDNRYTMGSKIWWSRKTKKTIHFECITPSASLR